MSRHNLDTVRSIFLKARALGQPERGPFLESACAADMGLRAEVEELLAADTAATLVPAMSEGSPSWAQGIIQSIKIPGYKLLHEIGHGGQAVVWAATQESTGRTVAVKLITPGVLSSSMVRRFLFEAEALAKLAHPNIAALYDAGTAGSSFGAHPFLAMELVEGQPLTTYAREHKLPLRQRMELLANLAETVHYAHTRGVIHRDLKPGNILVVAPNTPDGAPTLKVMDFGLARSTERDVQLTSVHTEVGAILGTLAYMSPEQTTGKPEEIDTRADVYALGVIAYELLAGEPPYRLCDFGFLEALRIIRENEPKTLSSISRALRGDLETIVAKAMEKDPRRRYQSASDFAADVRRYLRDEPVLARPQSAWYQLSKFSKRHKPLVAGVVATLCALVTGSVLHTWQYMRAYEHEKLLRQSAEQAQSRTKAALEATEQAQARTEAALRVAENRLTKLQQLGLYMFELERAIADLPQSAPIRAIRARIASTARVFLDDLASGVGEDAQTQRGLVAAYQRIGDIQTEVGQRAEALSSYNKAVEIARKLAEGQPARTEPQRTLTHARVKASAAAALVAQERAWRVVRGGVRG